jgi:hypothetical protein
VLVALRRSAGAARAGPLVGAAVLLPLLLLDHYLWTQPGGRTLVVWSFAVLAAVVGQRDRGPG